MRGRITAGMKIACVAGTGWPSRAVSAHTESALAFDSGALTTVNRVQFT
jgi:hypothetical protein